MGREGRAVVQADQEAGDDGALAGVALRDFHEGGERIDAGVAVASPDLGRPLSRRRPGMGLGKELRQRSLKCAYQVFRHFGGDTAFWRYGVHDRFLG